MSKYLVSPELISISRKISCAFVDYKGTPKKMIKDVCNKGFYKNEKDNFFISTCLRYEVYNLNGHLSKNNNLIYYKKK